MTNPAPGEIFRPLRYEPGVLYLLDQLALPATEVWLECRDEQAVAEAISTMKVRGAPAIGCTAAFGMALAARRLGAATSDSATFADGLARASALLAATRPTAVNLFWALTEMTETAAAALSEASGQHAVAAAVAALQARAIAIHEEDVAMCVRIGELGGALIPDGATVLTHCNAGALATGGYGTALGVIRGARAAGKKVRVIADETRPFLQGARLTAWELMREGFDVTLIPDGAAAFLLARGEIDCAVVGADRIAANGDVANKIGTYGVALAAHAAGVPFYVAAPTSTIDLQTATGADIPIEERSDGELLSCGGVSIAPAGARGRYPAFDVTPAALVTAIITDRGVIRAPYLPESLIPNG